MRADAMAGASTLP